MIAKDTKAALLRGMKTVAAAADIVRPPSRGIVILLYHRVGRRSALEIDLPTALFARQMEQLQEEGRTATLDQALEALGSAHPPSRDPVCVTFDDGTADFVDEALPILQRHGIAATIYIATEFIETGVAFPNGGTPLSWSALEEALSTGLVTIGSHTHTHAVLRTTGAREAEEEVRRSMSLIEDRLGVVGHHFAYPKGVRGSGPADGVVRKHFRSAVVGGGGSNQYGRTDPFRLARSPIQLSDDMRWFERKVAGGMRLEQDLRTALNSVRYVRATH